MNSSQYSPEDIETQARIVKPSQPKSFSVAGRKDDYMKAMVFHKYGSPDVLNLEEVQKPTPKDNIDKQYPLPDLPEAIRYLEEGRAQGKIVINVTQNSQK